MTAKATPQGPRSWPRGWFLLASAVSLGLSLWAVQSASREAGGLPGLVRLELAGTMDSAQWVVTALRKAGATESAVRGVQRDYLVILSCLALLGFLGTVAVGVKGLWEIALVRRALYAVILLQGVAAVLNGVGNVLLLAMLESGTVAPGLAELARQVSLAKWWLLAIGVVAPALALLARPLLARWRPGDG